MKHFLLSIFCSTALAATHPSVIREECIFSNPPFASCHASTLTQTKSGALLCAWFAGTREGAEDVAIWLSSLNDTKWSTPEKIAETPGIPCWNPVLFTLPSKEVLLFYKVGEHPMMWSGCLKHSYDEGRTWTEEIELPAGIIGPAKNKPLLLSDGTLLCGSSIESWRRWGCWIDSTPDNGATWSKSAPINVASELFGIIQPTLFYGKQGAIKMLARARQIGFLCAAESHDQGRTWSQATPTTLPNPNSAIDALNLKDSRVLLVYNHSKEGRSPLNIALSCDGGETWNMQVVLEDKPGEYSYPSVIQTADGNVHITYTWNRVHIKHVVIDPALLGN